MTDANLTRRDFLARGAGAVALAGAAAGGAWLLHDPVGDAGLPKPVATRLKNWFAGIELPPSTPRLSVAAGDADNIDRLVRAAVGGLDPTLGIKRFITPGDVVLLKPNVGFDRPPHLGATTHPEVVRAVIRLCREAGAARVVVTDNPIEAPPVCFAKSRIGPVAREEGAELRIPLSTDFAAIAIRDRDPDRVRGEAIGRWPIFRAPLAQATKVIGLAPVKDHNLASASITMKNWYGLLGGRRNQFHQAIHEVVSDLALMISPTLVIADGTRVMMHNGPTGGRSGDVAPGGVLGRPVIVAAVDQVACDAWCYENLLGRDPAALPALEMADRKIAELVAAGERRLGQRDWRAYQQQGLIASVSV